MSVPKLFWMCTVVAFLLAAGIAAQATWIGDLWCVNCGAELAAHPTCGTCGANKCAGFRHPCWPWTNGPTPCPTCQSPGGMGHSNCIACGALMCPPAHNHPGTCPGNLPDPLPQPPPGQCAICLQPIMGHPRCMYDVGVFSYVACGRITHPSDPPCPDHPEPSPPPPDPNCLSCGGYLPHPACPEQGCIEPLHDGAGNAACYPGRCFWHTMSHMALGIHCVTSGAHRISSGSPNGPPYWCPFHNIGEY
jgi:hypothetical protein